MLKIQKIGRGEVGRVKYPRKEQGQQEEFALEQAAGVERERELTGYYSEHGKAGARWLGCAAAGLGFGEDATDEQLEGLILEHRAADGEEIHRMHGRQEIVGLEVDLSAPKSFSDLYAIGDVSQRRGLMEVWNEAVSDLVERMERDYIRTRAGAGEARHHMLTGGVTVRAYTHFTSRLQDPQLHAHLLLPNMAQERLTGEYKALDTAFLFANAKALGHWFEARLRELSERELGIEWGEVSKGVAEIKGVPESYLEATSQRSQVIKAKEAALVGKGVRVDVHMRDEIAMETRRGKELIEDLGEWQALQRAIAEEHGLNAEAVAALTPGAREVEASGVDVGKLADQLLSRSGLTVMRTTFEPGKILIALTDAGVKEHELDTAITQILEDDRVIPVKNLLGPTYTTRELLEREQELIQAFQDARGEAEELVVEESVLDSVLAGAELTLNDDQLAALRAITGRADGMVVVQARAGTGKTTVARFARQVYERSGIGVLGAAPSAQAKRELQAAGLVNSETLARLAGHVRDGGNLRDFLSGGARHGVLLLDEAGMAHTREAALVITRARAEGMKVIVMGDSRQLQSVQAGGWMGHLHRTYGGPTLSEIVRQRDKHERRALTEVAARKPRAYIQHQQTHGRIHEYALKDTAAAVQHASALLLEQAGQHGFDGTLLMSHGNQRRILLNETVQDMRHGRGDLGEQVLMSSSEGQDLHAGDRIVLKRNHRRLDVDNGMRATIIGTTQDGELLIGLDGDRDALRVLPGWYVDEHVRLGYAVTIYGAQGATVEHAILAASPDELDANNGYVAFSRNRGTTTIILVGDPPNGKTLTDQLQASLQRDGEEQLAIAQIREWVQGLEPDIAIEQNLTPGQPQTAEAVAELDAYEQQRHEQAGVQEQTTGRVQDPLAAENSDEAAGLSEIVERTETVDRGNPVGPPAAETRAEQESERDRLLAAYDQAVSNRRAEAQRQVETLQADLETATQRRARIREEFDNIDQRARQVGQLADTLERTFPTGYAMPSATVELTQYHRALENLASATKRKDIKQRSEHATALRAQLPLATRRLLDRENQQGVEDLQLLDRYQQSRAARDQLAPKHERLWQQAHAGDKSRPKYTPGVTLINEAGITRIHELEHQIRVSEATVRALEDPARTIDERLTSTLELNQVFRRPPASLQEANNWAQEWGHGLTLQAQGGTIIAHIPELPGWRHPLNEQQQQQVGIRLRQGQELGQQLQNLDTPVHEATRRYQRRISNSIDDDWVGM